MASVLRTSRQRSAYSVLPSAKDEQLTNKKGRFFATTQNDTQKIFLLLGSSLSGSEGSAFEVLLRTAVSTMPSAYRAIKKAGNDTCHSPAFSILKSNF